jgi:hypothetical protein
MGGVLHRRLFTAKGIETNHADGVMGNLFMLGPFGAQ